MTIGEQSDGHESRRHRPSFVLTAASVSFIIGYALNASIGSSDSETEHRLDGARALDHTTACNEDPLVLVSLGKAVVVADGRCRNDDRKIDVMRLPNESTTGPIATVETGTAMEADCVVEGQSVTLEGRLQPTSDKWVHVILRDENGVTFRSDVVGGYVSAVDVIGDTNIPQCNSERRET